MRWGKGETPLPSVLPRDETGARLRASLSLTISQDRPAIKGLTGAICPVLLLLPRAQGFGAGAL